MPEGHRNIHIASFMLAFYLVWENDDCDYDDDYDDDMMMMMIMTTTETRCTERLY